MKISDKIIRNIEIPACINCRFYQPKYNNDFLNEYNRCAKFGEKDIVTAKIHYDFADLCRKDNNKCGKDGKYFEKEQRMFLRKLKHNRMFRPVNLVYFAAIGYLVTYYAHLLI